MDESDRLKVRPLGTSHIRAIGATIIFSCKVVEADDKYDADTTIDYAIRWFSSNDTEITDTTARSVFY